MVRVLVILSLILNVVLASLLIPYLNDENTVKNGESLPIEKTEKKPFISYLAPFNEEKIKMLNDLIDSGSLYLVDSKNRVLLDYYGETPLIPASTLKVLTSLAAIHHFGLDYRFKTEFRMDKKANLYIKGYGDPSLTTENIQEIVSSLSEKGINYINNIYLDGEYFSDFFVVPGNENSYYSYDAKNSALAANYNTIAFKRIYKGSNKGLALDSGDVETPFVPFSKVILAKAELENSKLKRMRKFRISIKEEEDSLLYFGHLFKELCKEQLISVRGNVEVKIADEKQAKLIYTHLSIKNLAEIIKDLMEFSNNFTANQLLLTLGSLKEKPAKLENGLFVLRKFIDEKLKLEDVHIREGSGLSYANKVTAKEMVKAIGYFKPYKSLLKDFGPRIKGKTGGLKTTHSLVGFLDSPQYGEVRFAVILNQSSNNRPHIIKMLIEAFDL